MSAAIMGIRVIMRKTGTSQNGTASPPADERDSGTVEVATDDAAKQAPPPPGMGKLVDKTV